MFNFHDKKTQRRAAAILAILIAVAMVVPAILSALL